MRSEKKKFIHFVPDNVYIEDFIKYIKKVYTDQEHLFYWINIGEPLRYVREDHVIAIDGKLIKRIFIIKNIMRKNKSSKIFLHYLDDNKLICLLFASKSQALYWVLWGADLYQYIDYDLFEKQTLQFIDIKPLTFKQKFYRWLRSRLINRISYVTTNIEKDVETIRSNYRFEGKRIDWIYPINNKAKGTEGRNTLITQVPVKKTGERWVLLGNSGDSSNNHASIIRAFAETGLSIKLIVPLSYGAKGYINKICQYGMSSLGNRFVPLMNYMSELEYSKLLSMCDISIMNHYRSQGMGNLRILIDEEKYFYLHPKNPIYGFFEDNGIVFGDISSLKFDETLFAIPDKDILKNNRIIMRRLFSENSMKKYYDDVFWED